MWKEPSPGVTIDSRKSGGSNSNDPTPAIIDFVEPGSIGEDLGFEQGDKLLSINGKRPRDLIDYQFLIVEEELCLEVIDANGQLHNIGPRANLYY